MEWNKDKIIYLRKRLGWTQNKFAKRLGVSKRSVIRWENGKSAPTVAVRLQLERIAEEVTDLEGDNHEGDTSKGDISEGVTFEGDKSKVTDVTQNSQEKVTSVTSENVSSNDTNVSSEDVSSNPSVVNQEADNQKVYNIRKNDQQGFTGKPNESGYAFISKPSKYDPAYIASFLSFLGHREAGGVTEVRIFPKDRYLLIKSRREYVGNVVSGYYDDYEKLARDVEPFDGKGNIYITINPCKPELLARAANRLQFNAKTTTSDDDILCDLWFPFDTDPIRPASISATDLELKAALARRDEVALFLRKWAQVVKGMSGNGGHGLIRLVGYPNNQDTRQTKENLTHFLSEKFTSERVSLDNTVFNMSRIWKLYGTVAVKGDDVKSRPYRRSHLDIPEITPEPVDLYAHIKEIIPPDEEPELLGKAFHKHRTLETPKTTEKKAKTEKTFFPHKATGDYPLLDVPAYLDAWGGEWRIKEKGAVKWYQFRICPLHTDYDGDQWECGICQDASGKMGAKCMHDPDYTWQDFKEVLGDPKPYYSNTGDKGKRKKLGAMRPSDDAFYQDSDIKEQIATIRRRKKKKAFEIKQEVSELIINDMLQRGKFYQTREQLCYFFDENQKALYLIGDDRALGAQIEDLYGINPSEQEYRFLIEAMITEALIRGERTKVNQFAFYDTDNNRLYVYDNDNGIYKLDGQEIQRVSNGTDGVLFLGDPLFEPFEYVDIGNQNFVGESEKMSALPSSLCTTAFEQLITKPINFSNGDGVNLNKSEQQWLFTLDIFTKFFEPLLPTKPIVAFIGPKGSGKTMAQRILLKVLFGSGFDVTSITKEDDFDAAVTANYIVAFDNVDGKIDWLNDKLAHTATGKMIQKRELYTTNRNIRFFPKCFLMLNARTPQFKREDVTDRLLLFRTEPILALRSEAEIITEVMKCRVEIWSELLNNLNTIVSAFAKEPTNFTTAFRIADWAKTAWRIAEIRGQGEELLDLLESMDKAQSEFLLEDNPIFLCLSAWLDNPNNVGREVTSNTLYNDFQIIAAPLGISFTYKSTKSFGIRLRNILDDLREFFDVGAEKRKNKWTYIFQPKG